MILEAINLVYRVFDIEGYFGHFNPIGQRQRSRMRSLLDNSIYPMEINHVSIVEKLHDQ